MKWDRPPTAYQCPKAYWIYCVIFHFIYILHTVQWDGKLGHLIITALSSVSEPTAAANISESITELKFFPHDISCDYFYIRILHILEQKICFNLNIALL